MQSAQRHIRYGRFNSYAVFPRLLVAVSFVASLMVVYAHGLFAADAKAAKDAEAEPTAFCFEVLLPITDAVEKSVTRRVEQAIGRLPKNGPRPIFVFEF